MTGSEIMKFFKGCAEGIHRFEARYDLGPVELSWNGLKTAQGTSE